MKRTLWLAAVGTSLLSGCIRFQGQERNPTFVEARAPDPTIAIAPVVCRSSRPSSDGNAFASQFRVLIKSQIHASLVELDAEQQTVVCGTLGKDVGNMISLGGSSEKDWRPSAAVAAIVSDIAIRTGAKSIYLPLAAFATNCSRDEARVRDERGNTVATIDKGTVSCEESEGARMRSYLFSSEGNIYWKSWAIVRSPSSDAIDGGVTTLLSGVPASFAEGAAAAEPPASPVSAGASKAKRRGEGHPTDVDGALATMDPNTVPVCRDYVRAMCEGSHAPAGARGELCMGYVKSMRPMTLSPHAAIACKAGLRAIKPNG